MLRERLLLLPFLFVFLTAGNAYPLSISHYYDSNGATLAADRQRSRPKPSGETERYAVPEGVELRPDISYEYYPVFGKSFSEAVRSAGENGPFINTLNRRATSKIDWSAGFSFKYDYHYDIDEETRTAHATVEISDVAVKYGITITMPALLDDSALSPVEKKLWKNYFQRLLDGEYARVAVIEDPELRKKLEDDLKDLRGLAFDNVGKGENIEHSVEFSVKEESGKIGQGWIRKINEKLDEHNLKTRRRQPRRYPILRQHSQDDY
jgi:predicted secreted Zn-dependent protease